MNSDRNLLFGILALRNGMIQQDQLIGAMNSWIDHKHQSLGEILEDRHILTAERHKALRTLVKSYLQLHDGDSHRSLSFVGMVDDVRDHLNQLGDTDLDLTLSQCSTAPSLDPAQTKPFDSTREIEASPLSSANRFRVIRPHARGGLGEVSVAEDLELNREVAFKQIQEQFAHDTNSRSRFLLEAEITGGLEHPGIVPVYGLGKYEDGRPYYAMRFIRGDSLKEAVDRYHTTKPTDDTERSLQLRKLLGRFIDVCNAVEYAHSRGVVHRDLKPGNVMLGKYGETLVVDWGLAKSVDGDHGSEDGTEQRLEPKSGTAVTPTLMGSALGTPAFMSPEQAAGRLDALGTASDVYSLGATLYYVLTGKPPVTGGSIDEVLERVRDGRIQSPRLRDNAIPRQLDAICVRAMATVPDNRYPSPQALTDDIERYLGDESVSVCEEPMFVRARRWMRKHPRTVSSMAATMLVGIISTVIFVTVVAEKNIELAEKNSQLDVRNIQLDQANTDLNETNTALIKANDQEKLAREDAESQQTRAQAVRDFLQNDLLQQSSPWIQANAQLSRVGTEYVVLNNPTIQDLLDRSAAELVPGKIETKFPDQPMVQAEILKTIGDSYRAIGRYDDAESHLLRAFQILETEVGQNHQDTVIAKMSLAVAFIGQRNLSEAQELLTEILWKLPNATGPSVEFITGKVLNNLAVAYQFEGKLENAISLFERALTHLDDPAVRLSTMNSLGSAYVQVGDHAKALPLFEKGLQMSRELLGENHPTRIGFSFNLAAINVRLGKPAVGIRLLRKSLSECKAILGEKHPLTLICMHELGQELNKVGPFQESLDLHLKLVEGRRERFGAGHPLTLSSWNNLGLAYNLVGDIDNAIEVYQTVLTGKREHFGITHKTTLITCSNLRRVLTRNDRRDDLEQLAALLEEDLNGGSIAATDALGVVAIKKELALVLEFLGRTERARVLFEQVVETNEEVLGKDDMVTLGSMNRLGIFLNRASPGRRSVELHEELIRRRTRVLGAKAEYTLAARNNLAWAHEVINENELAIEIYEDTLSQMREHLGWDHKETLNTFYNMCRVTRNESQFARLEGVVAAQLDHSAKLSASQQSSLLALHGDSLLLQNKPREAEASSRRCVEIREREMPDSWRLASAKSMLGAALLGQKRIKEAEPYIVEGYEGVALHRSDISGNYQFIRLSEALQRMVDLYAGMDKPDEAARWQAELDKLKAEEAEKNTDNNNSEAN